MLYESLVNLYDTLAEDGGKVCPIAHTYITAQIGVLLDKQGNFLIAQDVFLLTRPSRGATYNSQKSVRPLGFLLTRPSRGATKIPAKERYSSGKPQSGVIGVTYRDNGKWQATYKGRYLGVFETIDDAAKAIEKEKGSS